MKRKISKVIAALLSVLMLLSSFPVLAENQTFEVTTNIKIHYDLGWNGGRLGANIYKWMPDVCAVTVNDKNIGTITASEVSDLVESRKLEGQRIFSYTQTVDKGSSINDSYCVSIGKGYRFKYPTYNNADNENGLYSFNYSVENINRNTVKNIDVFIGLGTSKVNITIQDTKGNTLSSNSGEFDVGTECSLLHPNSSLEGNYAVIDVAVDNPSPVIEYKKEFYILNDDYEDTIILTFYTMPEYMNITITVLDANTILKVIANYIDENGNKLAESEIIEGKAFDEYSTTAKNISGYELVLQPDNAEGIIKSEETVVNYIYNKIEKPEIPTEPIPDEPIPDEPIPDEPIPDEPIPDEPIPDEPITESITNINTEPVTKSKTEMKSPSTGADNQIALIGAISGIISCLIFIFIMTLKKHKQKHVLKKETK